MKHITSIDAQISQLRTAIAHHMELWMTFDRAGARKARTEQAYVILGLERDLVELLRQKESAKRRG